MPELFSDHMDVQLSERGREKRHRLLTYLREHREELRPVLQKLPREAVNRRDGTRSQRDS